MVQSFLNVCLEAVNRIIDDISLGELEQRARALIPGLTYVVDVEVEGDSKRLVTGNDICCSESTTVSCRMLG